MKYFAASLLFASLNARDTYGINQGAPNSSLGGQNGYGYNVGNGYKHGDSHGHYMGNNKVEAYGEGDDYKSKEDSLLHIVGYDMIASLDTDSWDQWVQGNGANAGVTIVSTIAAIETQLDAAQTAREAYIQDVLERRKARLADIHEDNILKSAAPFEYQQDLLNEEIEDVNAAKTNAIADKNAAYTDLKERIEDYFEDREEALNLELQKVERIIRRAALEGKAVDDVVYGMRLDWLAGIFFAGTNAIYDSEIYDKKKAFGNEFDIFTYDIGMGKGHGHRDARGPNYGEQKSSYVVGYGSAPQDTKYEKPQKSAYELGQQIAASEGVYGYNQAADMRVSAKTYQKPAEPKYEKPAEPKYEKPEPEPKKQEQPTYRRQAPTRAARPSRSGYRQRRTRQQPKRRPSYRQRRAPSRRTQYSDWAPIRRGGYSRGY